MSNNEMKIFTNMCLLIPKVDIKNSYTEENFFYIFQFVDGYKKIEHYFQNNNVINKILDDKIDNFRVYDLIRIVRNRYSHIDKNNAVESLILLQAKVDKNKIHILIQEIKEEMNNIFKRELSQDTYKLIVNTRIVSTLFETINYSINHKDRFNEFDEYCAKELKKIMDKFDYEKSTEEEFDITNDKIVEFYKTKKVKKGIVDMYDEDIYNELLQMLTDDSYTIDHALKLMNKIKEYYSLKQ